MNTQVLIYLGYYCLFRVVGCFGDYYYYYQQQIRIYIYNLIQTTLIINLQYRQLFQQTHTNTSPQILTPTNTPKNTTKNKHNHTPLNMQLQKIQAAFERKGYTSSVYIQKRQYFHVLNSLMMNTNTGGQFYQQVAEELWQQACGSRPSGQLRVSQICVTIVDAQNILKQRIRETEEQLRNLKAEKSRLQANTSRQSLRRIQQINQLLDEISNENQSFRNDYKLVTQPFQIDPLAISSKRVSANYAAYPSAQPSYLNTNVEYLQQPKQPSLPYEQIKQSPELAKLFYLTLFYGFALITIIYGKYDFLNLIVLTCLLSLYLLNFFDKIYIRLTLALVVVSFVLDLVWLILYTATKWSPGEKSTNSIYQLGYNRYIIIITIFLLPLKIVFAVFLIRYWNTQSKDKYVVDLGFMKAVLSANLANPISKGLAHVPGLS